MIAAVTGALLGLVAAAGHAPETVNFAKDCGRWAAHYVVLLEDRAERDVEATSGGTGTRDATAPELLQVERARDRAAAAAVPRAAGVADACRAANRSQYECVMDARRYEDLSSCGLAALPDLDAAQRRSSPPLAPAPSPERRAAASAEVAREWLQTGELGAEALGTGSGGAAPPPAPPPSDVVEGGR